MKIRMDKTLRFWVDVAYDEIKSDHDDITKRALRSNSTAIRTTRKCDALSPGKRARGS
jgi:hypothetical protein